LDRDCIDVVGDGGSGRLVAISAGIVGIAAGSGNRAINDRRAIGAGGNFKFAN